MNNEINKRTMLSPREFAKASGLAINLSLRLCHRKGFPACRVGRRWMIHKEAADAWLARAAMEGIDLAG